MDHLEGNVKEQDREAVMDLMTALAILTEEEQELIKLRYFDNRKIIEIAKAKQMKEGTVSSKLHRTLGKLREEPEQIVSSLVVSSLARYGAPVLR